MLRRMPEVCGGYCQLIFRFVNLGGGVISAPRMQLSTPVRCMYPESDGFMWHRALKLDNECNGAFPPVFFLCHTIDENSPFYKAIRGG